ncbi:MAG: hypothetical protein COX70_08090 [Flavobacteriales bacterium CG_4_10_14_0_2_um_filter_32_8]|nr:MAG: hypothetical protein COX70_08090 [Flavobacteriales bacterium CG_4_10_14_0_2_um_filter_32_8]PJB14052.1 MAG: hypothetical protein CO118_10630 [Flavobacteriales bacterium CG_4_9_14_3_um_filter_32_8]
MKRIIGYFLQGLLYVVPVAATIYVVIKAVVMVDNIVPVKLPGLGILIILIAVTLVGFLGGTLIVKRFFSLERLIEKAPLLKIIYTSVKDLLSAFVGKKKRFTEPVLVKMEGGIERIGFITQRDLTHLGISENKIGVYIPFSYALTGNLIIVPKENVTPIQGKSTDIMKFIISGGITTIDEEHQEELKIGD